jgi:hypothetical protein
MGMAEVFPMRGHKGDLWRSASGSNKRRPSEGELADTLAERHSREVRFLTGAERVHRQPARKAQWIVWDGEEWLPDTKNLAQRLARSICKEASVECDEPSIDSARTVAAVLSLARCDPGLVCADWPCDPFIEEAVAAWLADHCVLDPNAWTRRSDLLASFVGYEQFAPEDVNGELAAHGITYRRKANSPGFDGVRLKGGRDD